MCILIAHLFCYFAVRTKEETNKDTMEDFFIILLILMIVVAFIIAFVGSILKGLFELLCGFFHQVGCLFAGAGIYGIITMMGIIALIVAIIYIINN